MKEIYKYTLKTFSPLSNNLAIPREGKVLSVGYAGKYSEYISMWVEVDTENQRESREFVIYQTGEVLPDNPGEFVGTVIKKSPLFKTPEVYHIYEI